MDVFSADLEMIKGKVGWIPLDGEIICLSALFD